MKTTYFRIIVKTNGAFFFRTSKMTAQQALEARNLIESGVPTSPITIEILQVSGAPVGQIIDGPALEAAATAEGEAPTSNDD